MLLSVIPNNQDEMPRNQMPLLRLPKKVETSVVRSLFMAAALLPEISHA